VDFYVPLRILSLKSARVRVPYHTPTAVQIPLTSVYYSALLYYSNRIISVGAGISY